MVDEEDIVEGDFDARCELMLDVALQTLWRFSGCELEQKRQEVQALKRPSMTGFYCRKTVMLGPFRGQP